MRRTFCGVVIRGEGRGAALGYPTVNIPFTPLEALPLTGRADDSVSGIYAARVTVRPDEAPYTAAVYADQKRKLLEAHILDFPAGGGSASGGNDLYGCEIEIRLMKKIRDAKQFRDDAALRAAIADDVEKVRDYFNHERTV